MAGITVTNYKGVERIFRTFSFRDDNNYIQHNRKLLGFMNPKTKIPEFNKFFHTLLEEQNISLDFIHNIPIHDIPKYVDFGTFNKELYLGKKKGNIEIVNPENNNNQLNLLEPKIINNQLLNNTDKKYSINIGSEFETFIEANSVCKILGPHLLLKKIVTDTSLLPILQSIFPNQWDRILTIAFYLVINNESTSNLQFWAEDNITYLDNINMQSQRISELLSSIQYSQIMDFYEIWAKLRAENEYLALDITSISSYSSIIESVEHGYNRDNEKLEQVNVCLLFGEDSGLPIFSSLYPGSLNDVSILKPFLSQISSFNVPKCNLVMDKGFYSLSNIKFMLKHFPSYNFLLAVPFTTNYARNIAKKGVSIFDPRESFIQGGDLLQGVSITEKLNNNQNLIYHIFYNRSIYEDSYRCLMEDAYYLKQSLIADPKKFTNNKDVKKYLIFDKQSKFDNKNILINHNEILNEIKYRVWLIIVGNDDSLNFQDVIKIYRNKDIVEKAFNNMKNNLYFNRLRVQSERNSKSKLFITTIGLIIYSYIHKKMVKNNLYKNYSINSLLKSLAKLKIHINNGVKSLETPTKEVKNILQIFGIEITN